MDRAAELFFKPTSRRNKKEDVEEVNDMFLSSMRSNYVTIIFLTKTTGILNHHTNDVFHLYLYLFEVIAWEKVYKYVVGVIWRLSAGSRKRRIAQIHIPPSLYIFLNPVGLSIFRSSVSTVIHFFSDVIKRTVSLAGRTTKFTIIWDSNEKKVYCASRSVLKIWKEDEEEELDKKGKKTSGWTPLLFLSACQEELWPPTLCHFGKIHRLRLLLLSSIHTLL